MPIVTTSYMSTDDSCLLRETILEFIEEFSVVSMSSDNYGTLEGRFDLLLIEIGSLPGIVVGNLEWNTKLSVTFFTS